MNQALLSQAVKAESFQKLMRALENPGAVCAYGISEGMRVYLGAALHYASHRRVLFVFPNDLAAAKAAEDISQLLGGTAASLPAGEIQFARGASSHESAWRRLETLSRVLSGEIKVLCASIDALMIRMAPADQFRAMTIRLSPGDRIEPKDLVLRLTQMGYERVEMVEGKGQCAVRGAILDVYPPSEVNALRLEFFDDEVDSIRTFDCISQRSLQKVKSCVISPATEVVLAPDQWQEAARRMREAIAPMGKMGKKEPSLFSSLPPLPEDDDELPSLFDAPEKLAAKAVMDASFPESKTGYLYQEADSLEAETPFRRIQSWLSVVLPQTVTLLDWMEDALILLDQPDQVKDRAQGEMLSFEEDLTNAVERGDAVPAQQGLLIHYEELQASFAQRPTALISEFLRGMGGLKPREAVEFTAKGVAPYHSQMKELAADCRKWRAEGWCVTLLSGGVARGKRLVQALQEWETPATFFEELEGNLILGEVVVLPATVAKGFVWPEGRMVLVSDTDIYGAGYRKARLRRNTGERIAAFTDLKVGDYVVHENHGVGVYQGTVRLQSEGTYRDYLFIQYQGNDKLYVPTEQLDRVQRFIGAQGQAPKLNKLGGGEWQRQKNKVKAGLKAMAFDLTRLYAERSAQKGYAFSKDSPWQRQFEDQFPYELTPDQLQSVQDITRDMEAPHNMDRLLCGDVGYGKTEVALRAAFKAVMDSKQVAILAPTTILAQQHYNTILKRFERFPVNCDVLSRFRSPKEQKEVLNRLRAGQLDILVGTHRLLNKDVKFKDLGLLIVDEEQRFGVAHKEIIKNMKKTVDVLTLSATPIPRTLHMSMVGIRDMSLLETPPEERFPVKTHVMEYSDAVVRDAILRELSRGGQVYFLYNRVHSIEQFYSRLKALVPEARIGVAHGQMKEHGLEDVMMDFYAGSYDVLLCTTIIESGLDVPTANTLIVFDADRFGLSQLYQIRGRVGRSNRQAYAYFTVRPYKMLSETAQKRLSAIREFTEFGAGFRIAMRDLEIRGAGNILGPEQHGHLSAVGYDMYCKLIEETLREVRGEQGIPSELETRVDLKVDAFLPSDYVKDERQRMEMYKRIAAVRDRADREDIEEEMLDRFGEAPPAVDHLMDIAHLRALAARLGVAQVTWRGGTLHMRFEEAYAPDPIRLLNAILLADSRRLALSNAKPAQLLLKDPKLKEEAMLREGVKVLEKVIAVMDDLKPGGGKKPLP